MLYSNYIVHYFQLQVFVMWNWEEPSHIELDTDDILAVMMMTIPREMMIAQMIQGRV